MSINQIWIVYHGSLTCPHLSSDFCLQIFIRIWEILLNSLTHDCNLRWGTSQWSDWKLSWFKAEINSLWRLGICLTLHLRCTFSEIPSKYRECLLVSFHLTRTQGPVQFILTCVKTVNTSPQHLCLSLVVFKSASGSGIVGAQKVGLRPYAMVLTPQVFVALVTL